MLPSGKEAPACFSPIPLPPASSPPEWLLCHMNPCPSPGGHQQGLPKPPALGTPNVRRGQASQLESRRTLTGSLKFWLLFTWHLKWGLNPRAASMGQVGRKNRPRGVLAGGKQKPHPQCFPPPPRPVPSSNPTLNQCKLPLVESGSQAGPILSHHPSEGQGPRRYHLALNSASTALSGLQRRSSETTPCRDTVL